MFFYEYCKISDNTNFEEHLRTAASGNNNKKSFLGKAIGHNDHYLIKMGSQRPRIGSNWLLSSPYLQCWCMLQVDRKCFFTTKQYLIKKAEILILDKYPQHKTGITFKSCSLFLTRILSCILSSYNKNLQYKMQVPVLSKQFWPNPFLTKPPMQFIPTQITFYSYISCLI